MPQTLADRPARSRLLVIQPLLAGYRLPLFSGLCAYFDTVCVMAGSSGRAGDFAPHPMDAPFAIIDTPVRRWLGGRVYWQIGVLAAFWRDRPSAVFAVADFRALHFWVLLLVARMLGVPLYAHGQGMFAKIARRNWRVHRLALHGVMALARSYVCYNDYVRDQMRALGLPARKMSVMVNMIEGIIPIDPRRKTPKAGHMIFLGRLRAGHGLETLFAAMARLGAEAIPCHLRVIGAGPDQARLQDMAREMGLAVDFHGALHEDAAIAACAQECQIGVYAGDAGLSVIHYMALGLVPVTHGTIHRHMGPEPAELVDGANARLFARGDAQDLARVLGDVICDPARAQDLAQAAHDRYLALSATPMAAQLAQIMGRA